MEMEIPRVPLEIPSIGDDSPTPSRAGGGSAGRAPMHVVSFVLLLALAPRVGTAAPYDITVGPHHEYDPISGGRNCILSQIDDTHYLCLYRGAFGQAAFASILSIDPGNWTIGTESTILYDPEFGYYNALSPIDATHYLGVHNMWDVTGRAGVFTVDPETWSIIYGTEYAFETESGFDFKLFPIDATHHLCIYPSQAGGYFARAVVLVVDSGDWTVGRAHAPVTFAADCDAYCFASRIDGTHFLCVYQGPDSDGWAVVLTVDPGDWSISMGTPFEYDPAIGGEPNLTRVDATHHLCAYKGEDADGYAVVLTVDPQNWTVSKETPVEWDPERADYPYLCRIDEGHYLCSYQGPGLDGWALVLGVELPGVDAPVRDLERPVLLTGRPSPFATVTTIDYRLAVGGRAELVIYDLQGRKVSALASGWFSGGVGSVRWNGTDSDGRRVAPGVYLCTLTVQDRREVAKLVVLR
jgi:hypothetical protein